MNLEHVWGTFYDFSGRLSELVHKLNFTGIGVIWVLKIGTNNGSVSYSGALLWALCMFVCSMGAALLQYGYATLVWGWYARHREKLETRKDEEFEPRKEINWPTTFFMCLKVILCVVGYVSFPENRARG